MLAVALVACARAVASTAEAATAPTKNHEAPHEALVAGRLRRDIVATGATSAAKKPTREETVRRLWPGAIDARKAGSTKKNAPASTAPTTKGSALNPTSEGVLERRRFQSLTLPTDPDHGGEAKANYAIARPKVRLYVLTLHHSCSISAPPNPQLVTLPTRSKPAELPR